MLRSISPLIWRRLLVRCDATIADLHATLQLALGWTDEHLNRFVIQGQLARGAKPAWSPLPAGIWEEGPCGGVPATGEYGAAGSARRTAEGC